VLAWKNLHFYDGGVVRLCCAVEALKDEKSDGFLNAHINVETKKP